MKDRINRNQDTMTTQATCEQDVSQESNSIEFEKIRRKTGRDGFFPTAKNLEWLGCEAEDGPRIATNGR